jgi:hypothetical protein
MLITQTTFGCELPCAMVTKFLPMKSSLGLVLLFLHHVDRMELKKLVKILTCYGFKSINLFQSKWTDKNEQAIRVGSVTRVGSIGDKTSCYSILNN